MAISLLDSHSRVPAFTSGKDPLFKMGWKTSNYPLPSMNKFVDYMPEDLLVNLDTVDGVGFMKSMVNFFEKWRISDDGSDGDKNFGWKFVRNNGDRTYIKVKWEGDELVTDNQKTAKTGPLPFFMIRKDLTQKMKWVIIKETRKRQLGSICNRNCLRRRYPI